MSVSTTSGRTTNLTSYESRRFGDSCSSAMKRAASCLRACCRALLTTRAAWPRLASPRHCSQCSHLSRSQTRGSSPLAWCASSAGARTFACRWTRCRIASTLSSRDAPSTSCSVILQTERSIVRACCAFRRVGVPRPQGALDRAGHAAHDCPGRCARRVCSPRASASGADAPM